jgi:phenylpyruvate tautomerase PptA (4-oxalocrotonate tautomerase family)
MPYLQLDVNKQYSATDKRRLAKAMTETYARMMSVDIRRISVAIRELGDGGVWRITEVGSDPVPVSVMMLDIRRGRPPELRMAVAKALCKLCVDLLCPRIASTSSSRSIPATRCTTPLSVATARNGSRASNKRAMEPRRRATSRNHATNRRRFSQAATYPGNPKRLEGAMLLLLGHPNEPAGDSRGYHRKPVRPMEACHAARRLATRRRGHRACPAL